MTSEWINAMHLQCPACGWDWYAKTKPLNRRKLLDPGRCPMCGKEVTEDDNKATAHIR